MNASDFYSLRMGYAVPSSQPSEPRYTASRPALLNPPVDFEMTFEQWYTEFQALLQIVVTNNGDQKAIESLLSHARKRIRP